MKTRIFHATLFLLMLLITPAFSFAAPNIFYTDIISGPNTGGENNKGIYLSVFGKNFGTSGLGTTVKVYINNVEVDNYRYLGTSLGRSDIQQITVQIGAIGNPAPGTPLPIKVVVNSAESNTNHTFTVQPGDIRFVDNVSGNDATAVKNDITRPWRYVQTPSEGGVLSTSVTRPGDVIVMRGRGALWSDVGFDNRFARFRHATGTAPNGEQGSGPITIMAYPGEDVHIKPSSNTSGSIHGIGYSYPEFSDWITITGLRIEGGDRTVNDGPINLQANSDNWRIVNNELFDWFAEDGSQGTEAKAGGITGNGKNISILGNHIHHIGGGTLNHGIYLDTGATNVEIAYNNMHNMTGGNIIQTFDNLGTADLKNISIHHNLMHDGSRYGLNLSGGTDSAIAWNNIIYNTAFAGARLSIAGSSNAEIHVIYNTFYNNNTVNGGDGRAPIVNSWNLTQRPVFVKNNIIYSGPFSTSYYTNYGTGSAVLDRNLYFGLSLGLVPQQDANPVGGTDLNNPLFSDPGSGNFHLQAGSPAIDQATDNQPFTLPNDYDLVARPQGVRADTGALEYVGGGGGNAAPTVTLSANTTSGNAPLSVNFTANAADPDGTISQYEWDLDGNGTYEAANTNSTRAYTYNSAGTYNARVRVTDNSASTATSVVTITVSTASGGGNGGNTGESGGDASSSGGSGCGFVRDDGKGQKAKGEGVVLMVMLIITLTGIALAKRRTKNITATKEGVLVMKIRKNSLIRFSAISFLITIFWSASAYAQPTITGLSGSLVHKGTITITGSGFGAKTTGAPLIWDNFEFGTDGTSLTTNGWIKLNSASDPTISTTHAYGQETRAGYNKFWQAPDNNENHEFGSAYKSLTPSLKMYASYMVYWSYTGNRAGIFKLARINGTKTYNGNPYFSLQFQPNGAPIDGGWIYAGYNDGGTIIWGDNDATMSNGAKRLSKDGWHRVEMYLKLTDPPTTGGNGVITISLDNVLQTFVKPLGATNRNSGSTTNLLQYFLLPLMWANNTVTDDLSPTIYTEVWTDDVYVDDTRARVEIGNAPTWAASTHREIQIPSVWSDASIIITLNQGSFSNLNNAYLYVIDADGNVNENGYLLSDGGATPPPSGGDTTSSNSSASGGSGCGFVRDNGKGQGAKSEGLIFVIMLVLGLAGIAAAGRIAKAKRRFQL